MKTGISTACLYPMEAELALQHLLRLGFRNFEFFVNSAQELKDEFLFLMKQQLDSCGATIRSIHPFTSVMETSLFFSDYPRRFMDGLEFYKRYCYGAAYLGAELLVLHGQRPLKDGSYQFRDEEYIENYKKLFDVCKTQGVTLCQENVFNFRSSDSGLIKKMHETLGESCAFTFDIKQCLLANEKPEEMLSAMGDRLMHVHISDSTINKSCLLPGDGEYPLLELLRLLKKMDYSQSVIIEVYSNCYSSIEQLGLAGKYLDKLILQLA